MTDQEWLEMWARLAFRRRIGSRGQERAARIMLAAQDGRREWAYV